MNKETRLILENQRGILHLLHHQAGVCEICKNIIEKQIDKTEKLLAQPEDKLKKQREKSLEEKGK